MKELSTVASAVGLAGPDLTWFDEVVAPGAVHYGTDGGVTNQHELVDRVTNLLYRLYYSVGAPVLWGAYNGQLSTTPALSIAAVLHAANACRGRVETDWRYVEPNGRGGHVVEKDGLRLTVPKVQGAARAGAAVSVELPGGSFGRSQGFYVAHSEVPFPVEGPLTRLYLNVSCAFAGHLMHQVTTVLSARRLPFDFKIADDARSFQRCDTAVLYCRREDFLAVVDALSSHLCAAGRRGFLRNTTPAMTCPLAPGVAAADDPANGESFGQHRCRIIAHGIVAALTAVPGGHPGQSVENAFVRASVSIDKPYLNDPTTDPYANGFPT